MVLILEDDLLFSKRLFNAVQTLGHAPQVLTEVETFLEKAKSETPILAIINLASPRFEGLGAVKSLKAQPETASLPILGYAGHKEKAIREEAKAAGVSRIASNSEITFKLPQLIQLLTGQKETA